MQYTPIFKADTQRREANFQTVSRYFSLEEDRWTLFAEDCVFGPGYTFDLMPVLGRGIDELRAAEAAERARYPEWTYSRFVYFQNEDPDRILVECDGEGQVEDGGRRYAHSDHYFHYFELREGKISLYRRFMNPCRELRDLGIEMQVADFREMPGGMDDGTRERNIPYVDVLPDVPARPGDEMDRATAVSVANGYVSMAGRRRPERAGLFAETHCLGPGYHVSGQDPAIHWRTAAQYDAELRGGHGGDSELDRVLGSWLFFNTVTFQCHDPNYVAVMGYGGPHGRVWDIDRPFAGPETEQGNFYIHLFHLTDDKIDMYREIYNPCKGIVGDMGGELGYPEGTRTALYSK